MGENPATGELEWGDLLDFYPINWGSPAELIVAAVDSLDTGHRPANATLYDDLVAELLAFRRAMSHPGARVAAGAAVDEGTWPELARLYKDRIVRPQRSRLRRTTGRGRDLAVSLARDRRLRDGDVLIWDEAARQAVVARIHLEQVMVLDLAPLLTRSPDLAARSVFELGHAIGNQHWPAVVRGTTIYVPVTVDARVMASVMRPHGFDDVEPRFVAGQEVLPYLAPHEARRLFGGADQGVHSHAADHDGPP